MGRSRWLPSLRGLLQASAPAPRSSGNRPAAVVKLEALDTRMFLPRRCPASAGKLLLVAKRITGIFSSGGVSRQSASFTDPAFVNNIGSTSTKSPAAAWQPPDPEPGGIASPRSVVLEEPTTDPIQR